MDEQPTGDLSDRPQGRTDEQPQEEATIRPSPAMLAALQQIGGMFAMAQQDASAGNLNRLMGMMYGMASNANANTLTVFNDIRRMNGDEELVPDHTEREELHAMQNNVAIVITFKDGKRSRAFINQDKVIGFLETIEAPRTDEICGICMDRPGNMTCGHERCSHRSCEVCFHNWFSVNQTCPICRKELVPLSTRDA
jgi:hypothetical protein